MKILVLDLETTGLVPPIGVCEIAWLELTSEDGLGIVPGSEFCTLVNPEMPIPPEASAINGIYDDMVVEAPKLHEVEFPKGPCLLICHNVKYDYPLIRDYIEVVDTLCTYMLSRRLLPDAPNHKLQTLLAYCELSRQIPHRASGDILTVAYLLDYLIEGSGKDFWWLVEWMKKPFEFRVMPFGKYRNEPLEKVPIGYLNWLAGEELDLDMRYTLDTFLERKRNERLRRIL